MLACLLACLLACFDTAENEPCKVCPLSAYRSPRCLEEANHFRDFWEPELTALGYAGVFCPKYDPSYPPPFTQPPAWMGGKPSDGCAVFVKSGRWALQEHIASRFADFLRSEVNSELNFSPNFEVLVLGCIDADFCK